MSKINISVVKLGRVEEKYGYSSSPIRSRVRFLPHTATIMCFYPFVIIRLQAAISNSFFVMAIAIWLESFLGISTPQERCNSKATDVVRKRSLQS